MTVTVGLQIWPEHSTLDQQRDAWRKAEDLGVDEVFTWDHFFPLTGEPDGPHFEAYTLLAAMAERTDRVRLGALVTGAGYRNPDLLADMVRGLDHISGGRAILGIGAGWAQRDFDEYGYDAGTVGSRARAFAEVVPRIIDRFGKLDPPPVQDRIPVLVGGGGEKVTMRVAAMHADVWNFFFPDVDGFRAKAAVLDRWCAEVGRDPAAITRSMAIQDPAQLDDLEAFHEAGVTNFLLGTRHDIDDARVHRLTSFRDAANG